MSVGCNKEADSLLVLFLLLLRKYLHKYFIGMSLIDEIKLITRVLLLKY